MSTKIECVMHNTILRGFIAVTAGSLLKNCYISTAFYDVIVSRYRLKPETRRIPPFSNPQKEQTLRLRSCSTTAFYSRKIIIPLAYQCEFDKFFVSIIGPFSIQENLYFSCCLYFIQLCPQSYDIIYI